MAAIGNIRKHSGLLIGIVGAAMLLFVLGGALESSTVFFNGPNTEVGEINGKMISYQDFETKVAQLEANSNGNLTEQQKQQMRDQVWNDMLRSEIMGSEYSALGLRVSDEELMYIIKNDGNNASLRQYFTDPQTGQIVQNYANPDGSLNGEQVVQYLKQVVYAEGENSAEALSSWNNFQENYLRKPALDEKYKNLIAKGVYFTDADIERSELDNQRTISFAYISAFYNDIADEDVEVSDSDLKAYYNAHKAEPQFEQKDLTSTINFVEFFVNASEEDKAALKEELASYEEGFKNAESDTLFINENADTPFNIKWYSEGMFPVEMDSSIANGNIGDMFGPFLNANRFELVKVLDSKMGPDSVMASHILLPVENNKEQVAATMDSLKSVIEAEDNFAALATEYSKDPGSATKGGDLGWFTEGQMVPTFNDACFNGKTGDLVVVESQFGLHLINITDQTAPKKKVKVGIVDNTIEASQTTYEMAYNEASTFAITNDNAEKFLASSENMERLEAPNLRPTDLTILGRSNSRQIVRWAFESEVGEVSQPFESENAFIVALVTEVKDKGILPLEMVEDLVRTEVLKEKKAELLSEQLTGSEFKQIAEKAQRPIEQTQGITFSAFSIPGLGNEPKLIGEAFTLENGEFSKPIKGERGVYVIQVIEKITPEAVTINEGSRLGMISSFDSRAGFEPFNAMKSNSNIEDNRYTFF